MFKVFPPQTETLSEQAEILHDENTSVMWYSTKKSGIFTVRISLASVMKMAPFHNFNQFRKKWIS